MPAVAAPFTHEVRPDRGRVHLALAGELDLSTVPRAWIPLAELIEAGFAEVVVDLRDVTFLDSSALHMLVAAQRLAGEQGCRLALVPGREAVQRVFALAGLEHAFEQMARV